mmetsp:Transcript_93967/g.262406  ORF Transcript_93967/g.262406 Transcript_93967/m.262406 type:complete len:250 (+) Transcript_93967:1517-2266(+)
MYARLTSMTSALGTPCARDASMSPGRCSLPSPCTRPWTLSTKIAPSSPAVTSVRPSAERQAARHLPEWRPRAAGACAAAPGRHVSTLPAAVATKAAPLPAYWQMALGRRSLPSHRSWDTAPCLKRRTTPLPPWRPAQATVPPAHEEAAWYSQAAWACWPRRSQSWVSHSISTPPASQLHSEWSSGSKHSELTVSACPSSVAMSLTTCVLKTWTRFPWPATRRCPPLENLSRCTSAISTLQWGFSSVEAT